MQNCKLTITQAKREETVDKILKLIETEFQGRNFEGREVTTGFAKALLEEAIRTLEFKCNLTPLKTINHMLDNRN